MVQWIVWHQRLNTHLKKVSTLNIHPFVPSDFPRLLDIYAASKLDELKNEPRTFELLPLDQDSQRLDQLLESDIYVYKNADMMAYGALHQDEIRALFVHPESRGNGIGKALLEFLLLKIKGEACLYVAKSNVSAKALYGAYGFKVTEEFETQYNGVSVLANKMIRID